jgi:hypothetical protein
LWPGPLQDPAFLSFSSGAPLIVKNHGAVDHLKFFIIQHDLPKTDFALFNVKCPYCGKSDRIRQLEPPDSLNSQFNPQDLTEYTKIWHNFARPGDSLGVCKFCDMPLKLINNSSAEPLFQGE